MTSRDDHVFRHASEIAERRHRAARSLQAAELKRMAGGLFHPAARALRRLARRPVSAGNAASR
ncbi:MAG: hypothetical protein OEM24_09135 [Paracoccaceae bacterium]|nr:hypothetical protein [Paracoccaceae bacterium]